MGRSMRKRVPLMLAYGLFVALMVAVEPASADVGKEAGNLLKSWAGSLFMGVTGIMAVYFLMKRQIAEGMAFVAMAIVLGLFVLAPGEAKNIITDIWQKLGG